MQEFAVSLIALSYLVLTNTITVLRHVKHGSSCHINPDHESLWNTLKEVIQTIIHWMIQRQDR